VTLRIIAEECRNNTTNLLCFFVNFKKCFYFFPRTNLWNRLENIKVPFKLITIVLRLYENDIAKFKRTKGWS
jgi:hypothetical protein